MQLYNTWGMAGTRPKNELCRIAAKIPATATNCPPVEILDLDLALVWVRLAVQAGHQWFQHRHSIDPILYANMTNLV